MRTSVVQIHNASGDAGGAARQQVLSNCVEFFPIAGDKKESRVRVEKFAADRTCDSRCGAQYEDATGWRPKHWQLPAARKRSRMTGLCSGRTASTPGRTSGIVLGSSSRLWQGTCGRRIPG